MSCLQDNGADERHQVGKLIWKVHSKLYLKEEIETFQSLDHPKQRFLHRLMAMLDKFTILA